VSNGDSGGIESGNVLGVAELANGYERSGFELGGDMGKACCLGRLR
jgi:hypothetical protein